MLAVYFKGIPGVHTSNRTRLVLDESPSSPLASGSTCFEV